MEKLMQRTKEQQAILRRVAAKIREEPGSYGQSDWVQFAEDGCGTTACVAGHVLLTGSSEHYEVASFLVSPKICRRDSGKWLHASEVQGMAKEALGLNWREADHLFDAEWKPSGWDRRFGQKGLARLVAADLERIADGVDPLTLGRSSGR